MNPYGKTSNQVNTSLRWNNFCKFWMHGTKKNTNIKAQKLKKEKKKKKVENLIECMNTSAEHTYRSKITDQIYDLSHSKSLATGMKSSPAIAT